MEDKIIDEKELEELEDFDVKPATYEVWILTYSKDSDGLIDDTLVKSFKDPEQAIEFAKSFEFKFASGLEQNEIEKYYYEILVETVVETEPNWFENIGNLFQTIIIIDPEEK